MDTTRPGGQFYAFTQTLNSNYRCNSLGRQLVLASDALERWLKPICYDYELYIELHGDGNIHYHGILDVKDKIKYYRTLKSHVDDMGYVTFKPITDMQKWTEYCKKDKEAMEEVFKISLPLRKEKKKIQWTFDDLNDNNNLQ